METEFENTNEHYNDKFGPSDSVNTTFAGNESVNSYASYTTAQILENNEINSFDTQTCTVESNLSFSENFSTESIENINSSENSKVDVSQTFPKESCTTEIPENAQVDTSQGLNNDNQFVVIECMPEDRAEQSETQNEYVSEEIPESNMIVEEPAEDVAQPDIQVSQELVTIEEIANTALPDLEDVENETNCNVLVTEVDNVSNENVEVVNSDGAVSNGKESEIKTTNDKIENTETINHSENCDQQSVDKEVVQEIVEADKAEGTTNKAEGDLIIEDITPDQVEAANEDVIETPVEQEEVKTPEEQPELAETNHNLEEDEITETIVIETVADSSQDCTILDSEIDCLNLDDSMDQEMDKTQQLIMINESEYLKLEKLPEVDVKPTPSATVKKGRKGRKSTFELPMHVLGHDISKPLEPVVNGRPLPRPRLGVKVPYRNLTSQIVSKAEIEKEIMERGRLKMQQKGDLKFARSLTQRLARKIAPMSESNDQSDVEINADETSTPQPTNSDEQTTIQNDSDLLAILEGDEDEPVIHVVKNPASSSSPQVDESNLKALEREIALQQLSELPHQTPKQRIFRGKSLRTPVSTTSTIPKEKPSSAQQNVVVAKEKTKDRSLTATSASRRERIDLSPKKQHVDVEPQVKVNMVLKTYSRKRKISEPQDPLKDFPPTKKSMMYDDDDMEGKMEPSPPSAGQVYMTKSSRIIKKKVIWDPDEVPTRSPKPSLRQAEVKSPVPKTLSVKTDRNSNTEKVVEKKVAERKTYERKVEKPQDVEKKVEKILVEKKIEKSSPKKIVSPKSNSAGKPKKIRSEVDKLLMDEGAVKMLYELNNTDETGSKKKKDFYSVDRAQKEIIKKANLLKNELEQTSSNDSQISLRKKDGSTSLPVTPSPTRSGPILERKMSKDSTKSSVHTPPGSPFPHSQGSMLIRRRSSSSLSSSDDMEIEFKSRETRRKTDTPKLKKMKTSEDEGGEVEEIINSASASGKNSFAPKKTIKATVVEIKLNQYKAFTVKKTGKHVNVDLNYIDEKCYFTAQVLEELTTALNKFAKDKDCNILTMSSSGKSFCLGLDYSSLVEDDDVKRKELSTELSEKVKNFLICLLHFPKVLVACIQGDCVGLGVTMLPLFDMVIASDSATFTAPYVSLGCIGEAAFLLGHSNLVSHGLASELLYTGHKLTADEAFRRGLISKLCWPEKYKETLKTIVGSVCRGSHQSLEATKKQLRTLKTTEIEAAIISERKIWVEHWISPECQDRFSNVEAV